MSARRTWRLLLVVTFLVVANDVLAQARLAGVVRDSGGGLLQGAEVTVEGTTRRTTTDRQGAFQLSGLATGSVSVHVRRVGYAPQVVTIVLSDGDNRLEFLLGAIPHELDTLATREQQLWRERPLLREFEENRRVGLGQFVTREVLAQQQGGFLSPVLSQMRGLVVVRSGMVASHTWLANRFIPTSGCTEMEDHQGSGANLIPKNANCLMCFPEVYLDYTRISTDRRAVNIGQFNPDQLQAIEVYLGAAETPARYSGLRSGCGVVVLHSRAVEARTRRIASRQDEATRSRIFASASVSAGTSGAGCADCGSGSAIDASLGYTFNDRWVVGGRYAKWSGSSGGAQTITVKHALLEWYPHPEPGRFKWFVNAGLGNMSVDLNTTHYPSHTDRFVAAGLPAVFAGTGSDIAIVRRLVLTPFISHGRTIGGRAVNTRCQTQIRATGEVISTCGVMPSQPRAFNLTQMGTRVAWR